jgi:hypothetical protein
LIVIREAAFRCEETDKRIDFLFHGDP